MPKTKIVIVGLGGVGGYFGGLLAKQFYSIEDVDIIFFARGSYLQYIKSHGLKIIMGQDTWTVHPNIATDNSSEIGTADLIVLCTKSYDLASTIPQLLPAINKDTIILPLLNGVDSKDKIKNILPDNLVLDGCVYIVSRLIQDGIVENSGNIQKLFFGLNNWEDDRLLFFEDLFKRAGIDTTLSQNISTIIWEKFIFLSPIATATSYFDRCIGDIISNSEKLATLKILIEEVKRLAIAKQIHLDDDINEKTLQKLKALPYHATSSMHSDFKNNKAHTELQSLTAYVIDEGRKYNLDAPMYSTMYLFLSEKR